MFKSVIYLFLYGLLNIGYGAVAEERSSRLLNGLLAAEGQFPYAVSVQVLGAGQQTDTRGHKCGGALISRSHVVTVASCMYHTVNDAPQILNPSQLRVFAGATVLTNDGIADRIRAVANITLHPQYSGPPALLNNIAVITLMSDFPANVVTPISLPNANFNPADFTTCTVTGWGGTTTTEQASPQQRFANKYVYNQNLCMTIFNSIPNVKNILPSMVCAVSLDLLSSNCIGDDGNALVCGGTFTGVVSLSDDCRASTMPEVYTRISNYTRWIRTISGSPTVYSPGIIVMFSLFALIQVFFNT